jgi:hypothetical protein
MMSADKRHEQLNRESVMVSATTMGAAVMVAMQLAARKRMGVYVMRNVATGSGFVASLFCDHCPSAVVGVVLPDGSFHNYA